MYGCDRVKRQTYLLLGLKLLLVTIYPLVTKPLAYFG
jgi:hypothetical protein